MKVIAYDPFLSQERATEIGVEKVELDDLFKRADFITLHTPLTDKTRNIIDAAALKKMKKGVRIVNCARGGLVDEAAIAEALQSGQVAGAAFDVFVEEPAKPVRCSACPMWCARRISAPPPAEAQENVALQVAEQMSDYLLRGAITNAVNFPSISAEEAPKLKPFVALAEKLGSFAGQLTENPIKEMQITYEGAVAHMNIKALTSAVLAGLLRPMLGDVNVVSAPVVARERGMAVEETTREAVGDYESLITVTVLTEKQTRLVSGTVFADGRPRIVNIKGIRMDAEFGPVDDLHHQFRQARLHRQVLLDAGRCRHQHRHLPCRARGARRQRGGADRDRRRTARGGARQGARAAAGAAGQTAAFLSGVGTLASRPSCLRSAPLKARLEAWRRPDPSRRARYRALLRHEAVPYFDAG